VIGRPRRVSDEDILAAAARVLGQAGPGGMSLAAVAGEVGLSAPGVLARFGSKQALLVAVAAEAADSVAAHFAAAAAGQGSALARLHRALAAMVEGITHPAELANHLALLQLDLTDPELHGHAARHSRAVRRGVAHLLEEAAAAGELVGVGPGPLGVRRLAETVQVAYNGALVTWAVDGRGSLASWLRRRVDDVLAPYRAAPVGAAVRSTP
jgi:AcrR family transcriptional regulator